MDLQAAQVLEGELECAAPSLMARLQPCFLPASVSPGVKWADGGRLLLASAPWLPI